MSCALLIFGDCYRASSENWCKIQIIKLLQNVCTVYVLKINLMTETFELPLFPLNTVLFPGMYLPLHIFEERYKEMINLCLAKKRPFGVVFISASEGSSEPEMQVVGCTARITQMQPLDGGRMNIVTIGEERFRIHSLKHHQSYLVGEVELAPLRVESLDLWLQQIENLYSEVVDYMQNLGRLGQVEFDSAQLPRDPETLVNLAASVVQLPAEEKQGLLLIEDAFVLSQTLESILHTENQLLRLLPAEEQGGFSLN